MLLAGYTYEHACKDEDNVPVPPEGMVDDGRFFVTTDEAATTKHYEDLSREDTEYATALLMNLSLRKSGKDRPVSFANPLLTRFQLSCMSVLRYVEMPKGTPIHGCMKIGTRPNGNRMTKLL